MCVLFMSWWVTYWQIEHCLPIPRLVGGSKLPGARIPSRQSLLSEIYFEMKYWYQCFDRLLLHPILIMMASSVCRNSGDENHVVMNEKVQALAGSIYEEFEKMLQRWQDRKSLSLSKSFEMSTTKVFLGYVWHPHISQHSPTSILIRLARDYMTPYSLCRYDQDVVKNLMPLIVNVLESLDLAYTESSEFEVDEIVFQQREFEEIEILWERFSEPLHSDPSCQSRSAQMLCGKIHLQESTYPSVKF